MKRLPRALVAGLRTLALSASLLAACSGPSLPPKIEQSNKPRELVVPAMGAYAGAYVDFGEREDNVTLEAIEDFEGLVGRRQAIVASSSYWGEQTFPAENMRIVASSGAVPLIFWSPWDLPYEENRGPDQFSLSSILEGKHDAYIDKWGDQAREFGGTLLVSFANEPNGNWFPWSGNFYGADHVLPGPGAASPEGAEPTPGRGFRDRTLPGSEPPRFEGPETFKRAYRYVVDRVRARGAHNVKWVLHLMNYPYPEQRWNEADQYYPGAEYCDWLGMSVYGSQYAKDKWGLFKPLFDWPYRQLAQLDPTKPIMVVEWGVAEAQGKGSKADWIREAFDVMKDPRYGRLKAIVFWHERWQNRDGSHSNLKANSSADSLQAYRQGVAEPHWLDRPVWKP